VALGVQKLDPTQKVRGRVVIVVLAPSCEERSDATRWIASLRSQ